MEKYIDILSKTDLFSHIGNDEIQNLPIYYIGGSQTLPPPLSQNEEEELRQKIETVSASLEELDEDSERRK